MKLLFNVLIGATLSWLLEQMNYKVLISYLQDAIIYLIFLASNITKMNIKHF